MRAIVLEGPRRAVLRDVPEPRRAVGEVLIAVQRAGICGSDVAVFRGDRPVEHPLVMGHEAVGRIADPGESEHTPGSRVVIEPNIPCRRCDVCRRGHGNVCPSKRSLGMNWPGVFADLIAVPSEFAHPLPDRIRLEDAVGIEPLAVAWHAVAAAQVTEGSRVALIGCGAEGLLLVQALVACGARVVAADLRAERLALARQLGAESTVHVSPGTRASVDARLVAPVVFEAAGAAAALELALNAAAPGGRIVALGLGASTANLMPLDFVRRGLTLIGSLIYDHPTDFQAAIDMVHRGDIQPAALVSQVIDKLEALPAMLSSLAAHDTDGKTVVDIRGQA
ncbi:MAG: alcohol dehydrogenase catalytic domain-containing protein [Chloroflexi bacterium]|nr:alcohol dehydrogenase catalytic domain-containing protein [Chloroflexota bacterium]MBV9601653.1 alcohol dehydrogenase catalytic domain-containing protein [Chloroflexota bacterium]